MPVSFSWPTVTVGMRGLLSVAGLAGVRAAWPADLWFGTCISLAVPACVSRPGDPGPVPGYAGPGRASTPPARTRRVRPGILGQARLFLACRPVCLVKRNPRTVTAAVPAATTGKVPDGYTSHRP